MKKLKQAECKKVSNREKGEWHDKVSVLWREPVIILDPLYKERDTSIEDTPSFVPFYFTVPLKNFKPTIKAISTK